MSLEEAARTGGRATVEDLQRSSSMPLEDYSGGAGKDMGALGAPLGAAVILRVGSGLGFCSVWASSSSICWRTTAAARARTWARWVRPWVPPSFCVLGQG